MENEMLVEKTFMSKRDLVEVLGDSSMSKYMVDKFFAKIRQIAVEDLDKNNLIIPNKSLVPSIYVWEYLKAYGITKDSVIKRVSTR